MPLPPPTASTDDIAHPANQPLDATQHAVLMRAYLLTKDSHPHGPALDELPNTQGEASEFIRQRYMEHFGIKRAAKTGGKAKAKK